MKAHWMLSLGILAAGVGVAHAAFGADATAGTKTAPAPSAELKRAAAEWLIERAGGVLDDFDPAELAAGTQVTGFTGFDQSLAPCNFEQVNAYIGNQGDVQIFGSFGNGGAILQDCAGFSVDALSGDNILAFDANRLLLNGNRPVTPQMFTCSASTVVGFSITSDTPQEIILLGVNENGFTDAQTFTTTPGVWEPHFVVTGGGFFFSAVIVIGFAPRIAIDDVVGLRF